MAKILSYQAKKSEIKKATASKYPLTSSIINAGGEKGHKSVRHELIRRIGDSEAIYLMELVFILETTDERHLDNGYFTIFMAPFANGKPKPANAYFKEKFGYGYDKQLAMRKKLKANGLIDFDNNSYNNQLRFLVNVDAILAMIKDEMKSVGTGFPDKRFKRVSKKSLPASPEKSKTVLGKSEDGLREIPLPLIERPLRDPLESSFPKEPKGGADAPLGTSPFISETDPRATVAVENEVTEDCTQDPGVETVDYEDLLPKGWEATDDPEIREIQRLHYQLNVEPTQATEVNPPPA